MRQKTVSREAHICTECRQIGTVGLGLCQRCYDREYDRANRERTLREPFRLHWARERAIKALRLMMAVYAADDMELDDGTDLTVAWDECGRALEKLDAVERSIAGHKRPAVASRDR